MERLQMSRFLLHLPIYLWTLFDFGGIKSHKTEHNNACIIKFNLTEFYTSQILYKSEQVNYFSTSLPLLNLLN